jgi:pyrroline-5-carboxylate reductase
MGTAILQGLLQNSKSPNDRHGFAACVRKAESAARLRRDLGPQSDVVEISHGSKAAASTAQQADLVLLGCAPGDLMDLLQTPDLADALEGKIIVSMLARMTYEKLAEILSNVGVKSPRLVRILPTLGAKVGDSVTLIAESRQTTRDSEHTKVVDTVLNSIGTVQYIPEALMDEATAIGAFTHALAIVAADTLSDTGAAEGLPRPTTLALVERCLQSASRLMLNGMSPEEMKDAMAIPTGITINSILLLEKSARPAIAESARGAISYTRQSP